VSNGRVRLASVIVLALLVGCGRAERPESLIDLSEGPPNVLFLVLDTYRRDHLGVYGATEVETPNLDAFAEEAIVFDDAASTSTWTLPSMASVYTGREPQHHTAIGGKRLRVPETMPFMAEILRTRGYETWALVAVDYLGKGFGMDRGFQQFRAHVTGPVSTRLRNYQARVAGTLSVPPREPWFGLVHYFDAHDPYRPPKPFDRMYYEGEPDSIPDDPARSIDVIYSERNRIAQDPHERYRWMRNVKDLMFPVKQYAAGVTYLDDHLGQVFERLRNNGHFDDSIVVVLADHGEHLTEHDVYFTHRLPYAEVLEVPLMIRLPGGRLGGTRVEDPVSLIDVLPTLMELLGEPLESPVDGVSLVPAMRGDDLDERLLFAEYGANSRNWAKSVWNEQWRYTEMSLDGVRTAELFDREVDPREEVNLVDERPEVAATLRTALDMHFGPERRVIATEDDRPPDTMDPETEERLRALGYID
jgi:arylsulfatase A-like enzyme